MTFSQSTPAAWQPPPDYEPVPSAVEGITVFAPRPTEEKIEQPAEYKCPRCGATTRFDVSAGGIACEHCGYTMAAKAALVGTRAKDFEFTLENLRKAEQGWGTDRKELACKSCGAVLSVAQNTLTMTCPFCASNEVNMRPVSAEQIRPLFLIPFKVTPETNRARAADWLGKGWFHPAELSISAVIDHFIGIYLPFWTFDAGVTADWEAEVGYERQERYYDAGSKEWRTRTVIDWRHENGQVGLTLDDLLVVGSSHISHHILEEIKPYDLGQMVAYLPDFLAGWQAHGYDVPLTEAWDQGKAVIREKAKKACYDNIPTHHVRNFSMTADFHDETWRYVLLPVYLTSYKFEAKVFQVMINGQTGVIAGQKPVAWWKIWLVIAAMLSPGLLLGLIGLPLLLAGGLGVVPLVIAAILIAIGGIFAVRLYRQAVDSEAA